METKDDLETAHNCPVLYGPGENHIRLQRWENLGKVWENNEALYGVGTFKQPGWDWNDKIWRRRVYNLKMIV